LNFFSLALNAEVLQGKTCQDSLLSGGGRSVWTKISGGRDRLWGIFLVSTKLDTFCYLTLQTAPCYVQWFWHNTGVWQTDGRTDGIAVASTALAMRALRRAVKTVSGSVVAQSIVFRVLPICWQGDDPFPLKSRLKLINPLLKAASFDTFCLVAPQP